MHDNSLVKALRAIGADCILQSMYTPIRTDEPSMTTDRVFFGGVHIYLLQMMPSFRWVPGPIRRLLDQPAFLSWATRGVASTNASTLADLTISMLRGTHGKQRDEVQRLVSWLRDDVQPDAVIFSNLLIGGCIPTIRQQVPRAKIVVVLQGDDTFIEHLPPKPRAIVIAELVKVAAQCDRFIVNTEFYAEKMGKMLEIPASKIHVSPLSIDPTPFLGVAADADAPDHAGADVTIGYLARIAPEKGFQHLVSAFIELARRPGCETVRLRAAGWLGQQHLVFKQAQEARLAEAGLADRYEYIGSPDLPGKAAFLREIDLLCVPTDHDEPKGLFLLEAMASGVPVVQPAAGAYPELIRWTGGGLLVDAAPSDAVAMATGLETLVRDAPLRRVLGDAGRVAVTTRGTTAVQAQQVLQLLRAIEVR